MNEHEPTVSDLRDWLLRGQALVAGYEQWSSQIVARIDGAENPTLQSGALNAEFDQFWADWVDWCGSAPRSVWNGFSEAAEREEA